MSGDLVITVAPCGAETTREQAPGVPYTPDEIADEARLAFDAGARMVHVHARWDDGTPTQDADRYIATVAAIRERAPDMIVQVSTGGAIGMTAEERLGSLAAEPEMASLTCGTVNFGRGVFENPAPLMLEFARAQLAAGVRPELEIFDAGHLDNARWLAAKAPLEGPQHHDLVLGVPGGIAGTAQNVVMLVRSAADRLDLVGDRHRPQLSAGCHGCAGLRRARALRIRGSGRGGTGGAGGVERRPGGARRGDREAARPLAGDAGAGARAARAYVSSIAGRCAASSSRTRSSVTCGNSS